VITETPEAQAVEEVLVERVARGLGWLLTEGHKHDLSIDRLCDRLGSLNMSMADTCVLGLAYTGTNSDDLAGFWVTHKAVCTAAASDSDWLARGYAHTLEEIPACWAIQHGFDIDEATAEPIGRAEAWDLLEKLWTQTLESTCRQMEDHR
jgi:hypothetical protein